MTYYFGCWSPSELGHHLYREDGRPVYAATTGRRVLDIPIDVRALDGCLLQGIPDVPGSAALWHGRGWTILSFWDRSGDDRPGSNSSFLLPGRLAFTEAVQAAKESFPQRWELIKTDPIEYSPDGEV